MVSFKKFGNVEIDYCNKKIHENVLGNQVGPIVCDGVLQVQVMLGHK